MRRVRIFSCFEAPAVEDGKVRVLGEAGVVFGTAAVKEGAAAIVDDATDVDAASTQTRIHYLLL
ncbi:MAG: hypothetical protein NTW74_08165 [Acidobacteria bacterium]|nr:hypothetical protein [Acidobacteriota bacterium]